MHPYYIFHFQAYKHVYVWISGNKVWTSIVNKNTVACSGPNSCKNDKVLYWSDDVAVTATELGFPSKVSAKNDKG